MTIKEVNNGLLYDYFPPDGKIRNCILEES